MPQLKLLVVALLVPAHRAGKVSASDDFVVAGRQTKFNSTFSGEDNEENLKCNVSDVSPSGNGGSAS